MRSQCLRFGPKLVLVLAMGMFLTQTALARRIEQPPWIQHPTAYPLGGGTTTVEWEFNQNLNDPVVWQTNFPPGAVPPRINWPPAHPETIPGPDGEPTQTWHIDEDGVIVITVQNDPTQHDFKDILIQITSDKATGVPTVSSPFVTDVPGNPGNVYGYPTSDWYTYVWNWRIQPNPPFEVIHIPVIFSTNIEEIVIDTISYNIPEPGMLGAMMTVGLMLRRKR